jgi:hypothetical protein
MAGLLSSGRKNNGPTVASGLQLQSSVYGNPIAIVYGTTRVAPNLIWFGDFVATPVSAGKGGKGTVIGGGGKSGGGQYTYQTAVAMALCEGPIQGIGNVYVDKSITTLAALGLDLFTGTYPQAPWGYLVEQNTPVSETHNVPATSPYQITVNGAAQFYEDAGVTLTQDIGYRAIAAGNPAVNEYAVVTMPGQALYVFNAANAGANVQITCGDESGPSVVYQEVIPSSAPYEIAVPAADSGFIDEGVVQTGIPLTSVAGSPAAGQYHSVPGGVYTFNAAQAGLPVTINYYPFTGTEALGYNGIAYVAASAYQLGESAALPNHNFEVKGVYSNSVAQEDIGEQDTISSVPYTNANGVACGAGQVVVEYYAAFISDQGVTDIAGNPLTKVAANPGYYEYSLTGATYNFSPVNYGIVVNITYTASTGPDADPSLIVADLLTNPHYGAAFPSQYVGNLSTYQEYCIASGLLISLALTQQTMTSQTLQDIATATNSAWVWSNGTLQLIPYGDTSLSAFGYTYTPPSEAVTALDDDDFMRNSNAIGISSATFNDDPVLMSRKRPADQINSIKLQVLDRANDYNVAVIEAKDQALIEQFKLRQSAASNSTLFCNIGAAKQSAQLQLQRQYIRNIYSFQLDQGFIFLDPMDIVSITDSTMGISNLWVRILEIQENDDSTLSFQAEEYLQGTGTAAEISFQSSMGFAPNYNQNPGNVNVPVIFEPTDTLAGELAVWMAVSGQNTSLWGGCDVYISTDGNSYANIGRIKGPARQGVLLSELPDVTVSPTGQTIDLTNTLSVNLGESGGELISGSQMDATSLNTLCYVDGEYIAYQTATLAGVNEYGLTFLVRGAYDSDVGDHAAGSLFARLDSAIFEYPYTAPLIGSTVLIKFLSFNIWGGGAQQLSDVEPYTYIVQGTAYTSPLPNVTGLAPAYTGYVAGTTQLIWNPVSDFRSPIDYEVRQGTTWSNGNVLYRTPLLQGPVSGDGTYWVAAHFKVPNGGPDVYSDTPISLVVTNSQITQNIFATYNASGFSEWGNTGWPGSFDNTLITTLGLQLNSAGNILTLADYLNAPSILYYGGVVSSGTYGFEYGVFLAEVTTAQIIISLGTEVGYSINAANILMIADYLNAQNILGVDLGNNTKAVPFMKISQDGGLTYTTQNWIPGSYTGNAFGFGVTLETSDPTVLPVLTDITMIVDLPDLVQTGTNISIPSGGQAITFADAYNIVPNVQVEIIGGSGGDDVLLTSKTKTGFNVQVVNGGVGVARTIDWVSQAY